MAERIIGHMNKDHQLSLVDYVVVYGNKKLSDLVVESVRITDVDEQKLSLQYKTKKGDIETSVFAWNETEEGEGLTVKSMSDIKAKLIAMAKYAANKQGFSHKRITEVLPPTSVGSITCYVFAALALATYFKTDFLRSAIGLVSSSNSSQVESFLTFWESKSVKASVAMYVIHALEMVFITWPKVVKYRMPIETALAWLGFTFVEGFLQIARFNTLTK